MGGTNHPDNLVKVTIEQHASLHKQLWEDLGHEEDKIAWLCLSGQITNAEAIILAVKKANTGRKHVFSEEHKKNLSESRKKQSPPTKGKKFNKTHVEKLLSKLHEMIVCDCCSKTFKGKANYNRHIKAKGNL